MLNTEKRGKGLFTQMSREEFLRLLDETGIEYREARNGGEIIYTDAPIQFNIDSSKKRYKVTADNTAA